MPRVWREPESEARWMGNVPKLRRELPCLATSESRREGGERANLDTSRFGTVRIIWLSERS